MKPEEDAATKKRKKLGGNKKKRFVEGWVEFEDKKLARQVAESLNGTQISRQKGDFYHDDLWTMLYLYVACVVSLCKCVYLCASVFLRVHI